MEISYGLEGVVVDTTAISLVDGANGVLSYRGHRVDDLLDYSFGEVAELVVDGATGTTLAGQLHAASSLSERELAMVLALPADTHPMHLLQGLTPLLDKDSSFAARGDAAQGFAVAAKLPTLLATFHLGAPAPSSATIDPARRFLEQIGAPLTDIAVEAYNTNRKMFSRPCLPTILPIWWPG